MRNPISHNVPSVLASRAARTVVLAVVIVGCLTYGVHAAVKRLAARAPRQGALTVSGTLTVPLTPGSSRPIDVRLANSYPFALSVRGITVKLGVDREHRRDGCSATRDFAIRQMLPRTFPILVPASTSARLSDLGVDRMPRLAMINRPLRDQGACRGADLVLRYRATAVRGGRRRGAAP